MAFLNKRLSVRLPEEVQDKASMILRLYPDLFDGMSHLLRVAVLKLYRELVSEERESGKVKAVRGKPMEFFYGDDEK